MNKRETKRTREGEAFVGHLEQFEDDNRGFMRDQTTTQTVNVTASFL